MRRTTKTVPSQSIELKMRATPKPKKDNNVLPLSVTPVSDDDSVQIEPNLTMQRPPDQSFGHRNDQSCLVQIYPADVVDGMLLIESERLLIGRDGDADLILPDHSVSRRHALITRSDNGFEIEDLDSTNGTFIAGQAVKKATLRSGDTIRLGSFLFKFLSAGSVESQYHETVYSALTRDALTGTMNKRYLVETLDRSIATAVRQQQPLSVIMVDIDHFKSVNDSYGHLVGDEVLREFGRRLGATCREDDLLARYGGEEFSLLLSATTADDAIDVAQRCRHAVCDLPFETASGPLEVTASFGVACLELTKGETGTQLIQRADRNLYEAKRSGRNRVCGTSP
ncbi:diguanylate cyclase [Stieleria sp. TO1_6]|uniref:GGDEF domain-containing protein n=1 Tax=Stieleria tagensis TaxID=2956795 RepID=UPI00209B9AAB|nr:GGDEF domain-containing protein [Stieleria tagensis]MCO8121557.1 diguanylate cyclase [Stieleria tagensis]